MDTSKKKPSHEEWFQMLSASLTDRTLTSPFGDALPAFPSEELQRNTTSLAGEQALEQANGFYMDVSDALERSNGSIRTDWQIVDFGSCWGRISRFFMRDVTLDHIHGIDVEPAFVDTCRVLFGSNNFSVCSALPPSSFKDSTMNLVTAYSVFSHLSEAAFKAWLLDFHRALKPRGTVAFTTRNEVFFNYCKALRDQGNNLSGYQLALAEMIPAIHDFEARYHSGEFLFASGVGIGGGGTKDESFYGEAFIPPAYIEGQLDDFFEVIDFKPVGTKYDQALFVIRKR